MDTITRDELKGKIDRGDRFYLVEVLAPAQYESGHLPGAINLPADRVAELAARRLPDRSREVVTYCAGGS